MLDFEDYIHGYLHKPDYEKEEVRKSFNMVKDILGEEDGNELIASVTIRLKNIVKVKTLVNGIETIEYVKTDWGIANSVANALSIKVSKRFWGRKSRYGKMPYASSIESSKNWNKEHIHALIRMSDLKEELTSYEIETIIRSICLSFEEVNNHIPDSVIIRTFPFLENKDKIVGNAIHYICKSSTRRYPPLLRQLKNGTLINA
jgi:hypothetical protein